jgi:hypothetical protein
VRGIAVRSQRGYGRSEELDSSPTQRGDGGIGDPYVKIPTKENPVAPCDKKVWFVANFSAVAETYYSSVAELERRMICKSKKLYTTQLRSTEKARIVCENARKRLVDHVSIHGC